MSEGDRIRRLEDREAIRDLLAHYCYRIARGDVDAVLELFTEDCRVVIFDDVFEGPAGLRALYASALPVSPKPYIHNHLLHELEEHSATGSSVFEIRQIRDGVSETGGGCYDDRFLKQDGEWKFSERRFRLY
jgi:ketosteroid isomerase-like protein